MRVVGFEELGLGLVDFGGLVLEVWELCKTLDGCEASCSRIIGAELIDGRDLITGWREGYTDGLQ